MLSGLAFFMPTCFSEQASSTDDLFEMSFEQLLNLKVSIASFEEQSVMDSPGTVYVITQDDIKKYGWRDLKEILASIPNLDYFNHWNWLPGGQRGFTGNFAGTLLLIDGMDVQNILANEAFIKNDFPSHKIERVEVLQGANSTLYGGNAAQGVINVITRLEAGADNIDEAQLLFGEVGTRQLAFTKKQTEGESVWGLSGSIFESNQNYSEIADFVTDPELFSRDINRDRLRNLDPGHFRNREENWTLNGRYENEDWYAGLNMQNHTNDKGLEKARMEFGGGDQSRRGFKQFFAGINFSFENGVSGFAEVIHYTEIKEKWAFKNRNPDAQNFEEIIREIEYSEITPSKRLTLKTRMNYSFEDSSSLIWGFDGWRQEIGDSIVLKDRDGDGSFDFERNSGWAADKSKSDVDAVFAQYTTKWLFNGESSLSMTAGIRYHTQSYTNSSFLPRLGFVYKSSNNQAWKLTYGQAFRPPTSLEFDGTIDEQIDSQEMVMWELNHTGYWKTSAGTFNNSVSVYDMTAKNFYERLFFPDETGSGGVWRTIVSGEQGVRGIEDQLKWQVGDWQSVMAYRWIEPDEKVHEGVSYIADVPVSKIKLGLNYNGFEQINFGLFIDHWSKVKSLSNSYLSSEKEIYEVDPWTTVNFNLSLGSYKVGKANVNWSFYIENIFDQAYYHANARGTSPYQFLQAPRNFRAQVNISF